MKRRAIRITPKKRSGALYPWDKWFSRARFVLRRGKDYNCLPHGMVQQIRNAAAARGVAVSVSVDEGTLTVTCE